MVTEGDSIIAIVVPVAVGACLVGVLIGMLLMLLIMKCKKNAIFSVSEQSLLSKDVSNEQFEMNRKDVVIATTPYVTAPNGMAHGNSLKREDPADPDNVVINRLVYEEPDHSAAQDVPGVMKHELPGMVQSIESRKFET